MKYILILFLFIQTTINAQSNNLDTVYARNTTMQGGDWSYLVGKTLVTYTDSVTMKALRKIRTDILVANPPTFGTSVTIDSIPGIVMVNWYRILLSATFNETRTRGATIFTALTNYAPLATHIAIVDAEVGNMFINERKRGKSYLLDN